MAILTIGQVCPLLVFLAHRQYLDLIAVTVGGHLEFTENLTVYHRSLMSIICNRITCSPGSRIRATSGKFGQGLIKDFDVDRLRISSWAKYVDRIRESFRRIRTGWWVVLHPTFSHSSRDPLLLMMNSFQGYRTAPSLPFIFDTFFPSWMSRLKQLRSH